VKLKPIPNIDRFGASDAWLMFALWMWTAGHPLIAAFSGAVCAVICIIPDGEAASHSGVVPVEGKSI
jgi:hypothetical protein